MKLIKWIKGLFKKEESSFIKYAKQELQAIGYDLNEKEDGPNKWIQENLFELLEVFSKQGHSGSSAPYCIQMFSKLAMFEPLGPLTGKDNEWMEYAEGKFQNIRCSHVFKDGKNGKAYNGEGKIFREPSGTCYTSRDSRVYITFPYTPKSVYVDVKAKKKENIK